MCLWNGNLNGIEGLHSLWIVMVEFIDLMVQRNFEVMVGVILISIVV